MSVSTVLFSFKGRIGRKHYWPSMLAIVAFSIVLDVILQTMKPDDTASGGVIFLILALYILVLWSSLALSIKRLHDCDYAGWFVLLSCIPIAGWLWLLVISLMRGTVGANRFGPDPLTVSIPATSSPKSNPQSIVVSVVSGGVGVFVVLFAIGLWRNHDREVQAAATGEHAQFLKSDSPAVSIGAGNPNSGSGPVPSGLSTEVQLSAAAQAARSRIQPPQAPQYDLAWETILYQADQSDPTGNVKVGAHAEHKIAQGGSITVGAACGSGPIIAFAFTLFGSSGEEAAFDYSADPKLVLKILYRIDGGQQLVAIFPFTEKQGSNRAAIPFTSAPPSFTPVTVEQDTDLNKKASQGDLSVFEKLVNEYTPQNITTFLAAQSVQFQLPLKSGMKEVIEVNPQERSFQEFVAACKTRIWQTP